MFQKYANSAFNNKERQTLTDRSGKKQTKSKHNMTPNVVVCFSVVAFLFVL